MSAEDRSSMGERSGRHDYESFANRLRETGFISDPWLFGEPRFGIEPHVLSVGDARRFAKAAEAVTLAHQAVAAMCSAEPELLDSFLRMTPFQKLMWHASEPLWHGIARADAFQTTRGSVAVCELNSDTPSGEAEAVMLNRVVGEKHAKFIDPNANLGAAFLSMIEAMAENLLAAAPSRLTVGIVYPTEMTEDLSMIALYRAWLEARGHHVVLGSPYNLTSSEGERACLFDRPCDVFLRHYKTDWWGEREPIWNDAPLYPDEAPLDGPLGTLVHATVARTAIVVNPFGSVVTQNKRSMALLWERRDALPREIRDAVEEYIPETRRLEDVAAAIASCRGDWVLKSDYGCEGDSVIVGRACTQEIWLESLKQATEGRWIAQRNLEPALDERGLEVNVGVYVIGGSAQGFFTRKDSGVTDFSAKTFATLVEEDPT